VEQIQAGFSSPPLERIAEAFEDVTLRKAVKALIALAA
jgi:hypothetical protein